MLFPSVLAFDMLYLSDIAFYDLNESVLTIYVRVPYNK